MLNEPSECSDLSDEEDELEERLIALRTHREQGIQRRLEQWEKQRELEESIQYLAWDLGAVNEQLRDMERAFAQFHREDSRGSMNSSPKLTALQLGQSSRCAGKPKV